MAAGDPQAPHPADPLHHPGGEPPPEAEPAFHRGSIAPTPHPGSHPAGRRQAQGRKEPPHLCWAGSGTACDSPRSSGLACELHLPQVGVCTARFHLIPCLSRPGSHSSGWSRCHPERLFAPPECVPAQQQWDGAGECQGPVRLHLQWKRPPPPHLAWKLLSLVAGVLHGWYAIPPPSSTLAPPTHPAP